MRDAFLHAFFAASHFLAAAAGAAAAVAVFAIAIALAGLVMLLLFDGAARVLAWFWRRRKITPKGRVASLILRHW